MTIEDWLAEGRRLGFCGSTFCWIHDTAPLSPTEKADMDNNLEPCVTIMRVYGGPTHRDDAEPAWAVAID
jgi:hypothetical protein